jgi:hypothetical protein
MESEQNEEHGSAMGMKIRGKERMKIGLERENLDM